MSDHEAVLRDVDVDVKKCIDCWFALQLGRAALSHA